MSNPSFRRTSTARRIADPKIWTNRTMRDWSAVRIIE